MRVCARPGGNLIKLKLSKINLRSQSLVTLINKTILVAKNLIMLDISWGGLFPNELARISKALSRNAKSMRNLNLSYNALNFDEDGPHKADSNRFMRNIQEFFKIATFINHINFSGMNFK